MLSASIVSFHAVCLFASKERKVVCNRMYFWGWEGAGYIGFSGSGSFYFGRSGDTEKTPALMHGNALNTVCSFLGDGPFLHYPSRI